MVISEIYYHPKAEQADAEFIELENAGPSAVDLSGFQFKKGIKFTFPPGQKIAPNGLVVVVKDLAAFRKAFGDQPAVAGVFEGRLNNAGELLRLCDAAGKAVSDVQYLHSPPWPSGVGGGLSLSRVDSAEIPTTPPTGPSRPPLSVRPAGSPRAVLSLYRRATSNHAPVAQAVDVSVRCGNRGQW